MKRLRYWNIDNGTCLLRETTTDAGLAYDSLHKDGQWQNGNGLAVSTVISHDNIDWEPIDEAAAKSLARDLGGSLAESAPE